MTQFVQAKCSNCGANLLMDDLQKTAVCPSCGTLYIISDNNTAIPQTSSESDFVIDNGVLLEYKGLSKDPIIPNSVTVIGEGAFLGNEITSVSIPDSVTSIKEYAFKDCLSLKKVRIPSSIVDIDPSSFQGDKEVVIVWPNNWKSKHLLKMHIIAHTENIETLLGVSNANHNYGTLFYYYCGRDMSGNYMFCERDLFNRTHTKRCSVFDEFEIVSLDIVQMYNELAKLFDRSGIPRGIINTVKVPYYGKKTKIVNRGNAKQGMVQVLEMPLCDDD